MFQFVTVDWTIIFPILNIAIWGWIGVFLYRWLRKK